MLNIGFVGLGHMGLPMAINLVKAGHHVTGFDLSEAALDALTTAGGAKAPTLQSAALNKDVFITMLQTGQQVEQVCLGAQGVFVVMNKNTLFIDCSSIDVTTSRKIYQQACDHHLIPLDAPVSGGQVGAIGASLSIMVGGTAAAFERALPLFQAMGKNIVHIGEPGAGQTTKACNQMIVGMTIQAVAEAFALAQKAGVDLEKMREVLLGGFAQSRILDLHGKRMIDRNFNPGFKIKLHKKDMGIALQTGEAFSVPLKGTALVAAQMEAAVAQGNGELDHSSLFMLLSPAS